MPNNWSPKRERQYEHIKQSEVDRGKAEDDAKEIAARTVNKQRREDGETESQSTRATGNPHTRLEDRTLDELENRAKQLGIEGSHTTKDDLIRAIRAKQN